MADSKSQHAVGSAMDFPAPARVTYDSIEWERIPESLRCICGDPKGRHQFVALRPSAGGLGACHACPRCPWFAALDHPLTWELFVERVAESFGPGAFVVTGGRAVHERAKHARYAMPLAWSFAFPADGHGRGHFCPSCKKMWSDSPCTPDHRAIQIELSAWWSTIRRSENSPERSISRPWETWVRMMSRAWRHWNDSGRPTKAFGRVISVREVSLSLFE